MAAPTTPAGKWAARSDGYGRYSSMSSPAGVVGAAGKAYGPAGGGGGAGASPAAAGGSAAAARNPAFDALPASMRVRLYRADVQRLTLRRVAVTDAGANFAVRGRSGATRNVRLGRQLGRWSCDCGDYQVRVKRGRRAGGGDGR